MIDCNDVVCQVMEGDDAHELGRLRRRRTAIYAAAVIFARFGYGEATLGRIAAEAGATRADLAHHFRSKAEIAHAVIGRYLCRSRRIVKATQRWDLTGLNRVGRLSHSLAEALAQDPIAQAGLRLTTRNRRDLACGQQPYLEWIKCVETLLTIGKLDGSIAVQVDCGATSRVLASAFIGLDRISADQHARADLVERVEEWWTWVQPAIASK